MIFPLVMAQVQVLAQAHTQAQAHIRVQAHIQVQAQAIHLLLLNHHHQLLLPQRVFQKYLIFNYRNHLLDIVLVMYKQIIILQLLIAIIQHLQ